MNTSALQKLRSNSVLIGTWLSVGSPVIAELAADCGMEWLLFDLEHGCAPESELFRNLQAVRGMQSAAVVRIPAMVNDLVLRVLDWGADGIMLPHVNSAGEAERLVRAANYPPAGIRGFSSSTRAYGYGNRAPDPGGVFPSPFLMVQIETMEGVENVSAIASVEGVDALFVGPSDLRFEIRRRNGRAEDYFSYLNKVAEAARANQKSWGILVRNEEDIAHVRQLGATLLAIDSDLGILRRRYHELVSMKVD